MTIEGWVFRPQKESMDVQEIGPNTTLGTRLSVILPDDFNRRSADPDSGEIVWESPDVITLNYITAHGLPRTIKLSENEINEANLTYLVPGEATTTIGQIKHKETAERL